MNRLNTNLVPAAIAAALITACSIAPTSPVEGTPIKASSVIKSGYYEVKKGDTLYGIALDAGQDYRDIAAWNNLSNPNLLVIGQILRVVPLEHESTAVRFEKPVQSPTSSQQTVAKEKKKQALDALDAKAMKAHKNAAPAVADSLAGIAGTAEGAPADDPSKSASANAALVWTRPSRNKILSSYLDGINKGMDFEGAVGDPIYAAAPGKVTLVTNTLRGYGNLVVIKHDANYASVYSHASKVLVTEGQMVTSAQKIAELGSSDSDRPKLHFEIRANGKPVDPAKYLPPI